MCIYIYIYIYALGQTHIIHTLGDLGGESPVQVGASTTTTNNNNTNDNNINDNTTNS